MSPVSIYTPAYNLGFLLEAYYSIKDQDFLEWVIFPNNGVTADDIPAEIQEDPRTVIVYTDDAESSNVGCLKKITCSACVGDILVELDEDDILFPGILDAINQAFEDPDVVCVYSDSAVFNDDARRTPRFFGNASVDNYEDTVYGWKYYDFEHEGFQYKPAVAPEPTPANVSIIHYAPDHVRAFRRSAYEYVGGYDASLSVCDDQDLMCRLYMVGKFVHLNRCGYGYRVHSDNTWLQRNKLIQDTTVDIQRKYFHRMVETWARVKNYMMVDLCGGFDKPEGYTSIDLYNADIIWDLNSGRWPFDDSSVGVVRASNALEHLRDPINTMCEIYRILKPGGYLLSWTPSTNGPGAWMDPTHRSQWNKQSFWYYTVKDYAKYIGTPVRFKSVILEETVGEIPFVRADLISLKYDFRPHGLIEI